MDNKTVDDSDAPTVVSLRFPVVRVARLCEPEGMAIIIAFRSCGTLGAGRARLASTGEGMLWPEGSEVRRCVSGCGPGKFSEAHPSARTTGTGPGDNEERWGDGDVKVEDPSVMSASKMLLSGACSKQTLIVNSS